MTNIELYINKQLCDIKNPENIGIRLNRILINPAELSIKDAQYSYSISLPNTPQNNHVFGYSNVEEVKNKFNIDYNARLIVDGITIFDGKFRMSEITEKEYKGNLVLPAKKTVKDIFGDKKMTDIGEWTYSLLKKDGKTTKSIPEMINDANSDTSIPDCIFPYVLYGLIPKVLDKDKKYTSKTEFDDTVRLGIEDFPPSLNCMNTIKQTFESTGYTIEGNAFNDPRLRNLYMSYKNPTDYVQEWNWGHLAKMKIEGYWQNYRPQKAENKEEEKENGGTDYEHFFFRNDQERSVYVANLFHSNMTEFTNITDNGTNVNLIEETEKNPYQEQNHKDIKTKNLSIVIPVSGFYKIGLDVDLWLNCEKNKSRKTKACRFTSGYYSNSYNHMDARAYEVKLLRDFGTGDFKLETLKLDGNFGKPNMPQTDVDEEFDPETKELSNPEFFPQYYPMPGNQCVQFIDPSQNELLLSGFRFGELHNAEKNRSDNKYERYLKNKAPKEEKEALAIDDSVKRCRILAIKHGWSHDVQFSQKTKIFSAVHNISEIPKRNIDGNILLNLNNKVDIEDYSGYILYGRRPFNLDDTEQEKENDKVKKEDEEDDKAEEEVISWYPSSKFRVKFSEKKYNLIERKKHGWLTTEDITKSENNIPSLKENNKDFYSGKGKLHQIVWLEKGERISLVSVSDKGVDRKNSAGSDGWTIHKIKFAIEIEAYQKSIDWLSMDNNNESTEEIKWDSKKDFSENKINLTKFLPSDEKIDDWLTNFCKVFNLSLYQKDNKSFELNVKQTLERTIHKVIDLSDRANILFRNNQALGLPSVFELGFKVNKDEQGYDENKKDDGGGKLFTGSLDGQTTTQTSPFSYGWFKNIDKMGAAIESTGENEEIKIEREKQYSLLLPVVSNKEVWTTSNNSSNATENYAQMMAKSYTNYAQRFWYRKNENGKYNLYNLGKIWKNKDEEIKIIELSNEFNDNTNPLKLNYRNEPHSILRSYFSLLVSNDSNYTEIECIISADEYEQMNGSCLIRFNNDLYYIASVEGYDPQYKNKTKLKLIRKV